MGETYVERDYPISGYSPFDVLHVDDVGFAYGFASLCVIVVNCRKRHAFTDCSRRECDKTLFMLV